MSTSLGPALPVELVDRLGRAGDATLVIPLVTVDAAGFPHVALLSAWEVVARDAGTLRIGLTSTSGSSGNLRRTGKATLVVADEAGAYYIKVRVTERARAMSAAPWNAVFDAGVEEVLADAADPAHEGRARLVSGIRFLPDPARDAPRAAVRAELAAQD